jgi:site-specific recombinase XerD
MSRLPVVTALGGAATQRIIALVVESVASPHSRRAYERALWTFLHWCEAKGRPVFNKALVQEYRAELTRGGLAPASINQRLCAVRKLAMEAADNGLLAPDLAAGITRVQGIRTSGVRTGKWLTRDQAQQLLTFPDTAKNRGKRDLVVLAVLIGCGLRREELASLRLEHIQEREGRWIVADLVGKGNRVRTVAMPGWAKLVLDQWSESLPTPAGPVLRRVNKRDEISHRPLSAQSVCMIVKSYGHRLGINLAAHDLRRTFAKLARRGGAALEQIQLSLGHGSLTVTERYLGSRLDLKNAPADHLGLTMPRVGAPVNIPCKG